MVINEMVQLEDEEESLLDGGLVHTGAKEGRGCSPLSCVHAAALICVCAIRVVWKRDRW